MNFDKPPGGAPQESPKRLPAKRFSMSELSAEDQAKIRALQVEANTPPTLVSPQPAEVVPEKKVDMSETVYGDGTDAALQEWLREHRANQPPQDIKPLEARSKPESTEGGPLADGFRPSRGPMYDRHVPEPINPKVIQDMEAEHIKAMRKRIKGSE